MDTLTRVLVTGATGFIGSNLARKLVREGFKVGIVKRENSDVSRINDFLDKLSIYTADIKNTDEVCKVVSHFKPDAIFHLATYYAVEHKPQEIRSMIDTNVLGTVNLLEASKINSVKLFVNTSSCFVYKESKNRLKESDEVKPINLYAVTKMQAEQACSFYAEKYGLKTVSLRLFPPYGPHDHERRLIPYVIRSLLKGEILKMTTGKQKWDFVYVDDIVDAYLRILSVTGLSRNCEVFNIGTGNAVGVQDVVSRIKELMDIELEPEWGAIPHRNNEIWFLCADVDKAKDILGWRPRIQILDGGLESTVNAYKHNLR